jgi:hypothetical protein
MRLLSQRALTISATVWQSDLLEVDGQDTEEEDLDSGTCIPEKVKKDKLL